MWLSHKLLSTLNFLDSLGIKQFVCDNEIWLFLGHASAHLWRCSAPTRIPTREHSKLTFILLVLVAATPASERKAARVPNPKISAGWKNSTAFSCESPGEPLVSCVWSRMVRGRLEAAVVDDATDQDGGSIKPDGVSYFGHDLQNGKCSVRIESTTEAHLGTWCCLLIAQNGEIFHGQVEVLKGKWNCHIKFQVAILTRFVSIAMLWILQLSCHKFVGHLIFSGFVFRSRTYNLLCHWWRRVESILDGNVRYQHSCKYSSEP